MSEGGDDQPLDAERMEELARSASKASDAKSTSRYERPDAVRAEIEFSDGSKKVATGEDAEKWVRWLDAGTGWAVSHGQRPPEIDFDFKPDWQAPDP